MWFDLGLARLFITSTLMHVEECINILIVSLIRKILTFRGHASSPKLNLIKTRDISMK